MKKPKEKSFPKNSQSCVEVLQRAFRIPPWFRGPLNALFDEVAPAAMRLGLRVFLVGGAVRDILEERNFSGEWDVVVFGGGDEGAKRLAGEVSRARGVGDPVSFPRFGTHLVYGAASRIEFAQAHLRSSMTCICSDPLTADALSRDFTLNALYVDLAESEHSKTRPFDTVDILDPGGRGLADIKKGLLRTPIGARRTFEDDPLRIFRAARLRASRPYRIDPPLGKAARYLSVRVSQVAPERILDEMNLILLSERPSLGLELLGRWNALGGIMPEVQAMVGFRQNNPYHFPDLFRHTLRVVDRCPADLPLRWAALLHDIGKPLTCVPSDEGDSYYGHEAVGADLARQMFKRFKAGKKLGREVEELIRFHMVHYQNEWSDRAVRRFVGRIGQHLDKVLDLVEADSASLRRRKDKLRDLSCLRERIARLKDSMPMPVSPLSGLEIMNALGIGPGPAVGRAKNAIIEAVVEGDIPPGEKGAAREFLLKLDMVTSD